MSKSKKEINWERRFHELVVAIGHLNDTAEYEGSLGCMIPTAEAWEYLDKAVKHYSQNKRVKPLPLPPEYG